MEIDKRFSVGTHFYNDNTCCEYVVVEYDEVLFAGNNHVNKYGIYLPLKRLTDNDTIKKYWLCDIDYYNRGSSYSLTVLYSPDDINQLIEELRI